MRMTATGIPWPVGSQTHHRKAAKWWTDRGLSKMHTLMSEYHRGATSGDISGNLANLQQRLVA